MPGRIQVTKTHKLFIGGKFPRSESARSLPVAAKDGGVVHVSRASRKDLRDAVEAARAGHEAWFAATPYLRAQIMYRLAEMMEGKRADLEAVIADYAPHGAKRGTARGKGLSPHDEVALAIDRVVHYAGWADKFQQVFGCANPVSGPYHNFTIPEPIGVVGVIAPDEAPLLGLVSLVMPVVCCGNSCIALASEVNPIPACVFAEAIATSDMPAGVINIVTGVREELVPHFASHRGIAGVHAAGVTPSQREAIELGVAENFKRVKVWPTSPVWQDRDSCESPAWIEPFVDFKTIWHPSAT